MSFKFSRKSLERLEGVDNKLVRILKVAIKESPIDFGIPRDGGFRTVERQQELYAQGRTTPGDIITQVDGVDKKSNHQSGKAVDVFAYVNGEASWDDVHMAMIAGVILSTAESMNIDVTWGGTFGSDNFKGWDKAHYELK